MLNVGDMMIRKDQSIKTAPCVVLWDNLDGTMLVKFGKGYPKVLRNVEDYEPYLYWYQKPRGLNAR